MAGVGQPIFVDQPRRGRREISGRNVQRFERFFPGEAAPPTSKTIVEVLLLYDKLERVVLPLYYGYAEDSGRWIKIMKGAISKNASYFNSHRMMRRYGTEAYLR